MFLETQPLVVSYRVAYVRPSVAIGKLIGYVGSTVMYG